MVPPPPCHTCERPVLELYVVNSVGKILRVPWGHVTKHGHQATDTRIIWLCADCVDEIVEEIA